jgi:hypothetical protein
VIGRFDLKGDEGCAWKVIAEGQSLFLMTSYKIILYVKELLICRFVVQLLSCTRDVISNWLKYCYSFKHTEWLLRCARWEFHVMRIDGLHVTRQTNSFVVVERGEKVA